MFDALATLLQGLGAGVLVALATGGKYAFWSFFAVVIGAFIVAAVLLGVQLKISSVGCGCMAAVLLGVVLYLYLGKQRIMRETTAELKKTAVTYHKAFQPFEADSTTALNILKDVVSGLKKRAPDLIRRHMHVEDHDVEAGKKVVVHVPEILQVYTLTGLPRKDRVDLFKTDCLGHQRGFPGPCSTVGRGDKALCRYIKGP